MAAASCRGGLAHWCQSRSCGLVQLSDMGSKAGHSRPASAPVLAPESALGLLKSRALSSVQASGDCRCALARRQSPFEVVSFWANPAAPVDA
jgi:hypothetical protein